VSSRAGSKEPYFGGFSQKLCPVFLFFRLRSVLACCLVLRCAAVTSVPPVPKNRNRNTGHNFCDDPSNSLFKLKTEQIFMWSSGAGSKEPYFGGFFFRQWSVIRSSYNTLQRTETYCDTLWHKAALFWQVPKKRTELICHGLLFTFVNREHIAYCCG